MSLHEIYVFYIISFDLVLLCAAYIRVINAETTNSFKYKQIFSKQQETSQSAYATSNQIGIFLWKKKKIKNKNPPAAKTLFLIK